MFRRSIHCTLWLKNKIAKANGDVAIVCLNQSDTDQVWDLILKFGHARFRTLTPGIGAALGCRGFDMMFLDESFSMNTKLPELSWFASQALTRLCPGKVHEWWNKHV